MMKKIVGMLVLVGIVALVVLRLAGNLQKNQQQLALASREIEKIPVRVLAVTTDTLRMSFEVLGVFEPVKRLEMVSETEGQVTAVPVSEGDRLRKGQQIAQVDDKLAAILLKTRQTTLKKLCLDLERFRKLAEKEGVTQKQVEDITMQVEAAEAELEMYQKQFRDKTLRSPVAGTLEVCHLEVGSYVSPGMNIATIVDISKLKAVVSLTARQVVTVTTGQSVRIIPEQTPDQPLHGKVSRIANLANPDKSYTVEITFRSPGSGLIKPGMYGRALFDTRPVVNATVIPRAAVVGGGQAAHVYVAKEGKALKTMINTGMISGDYIQVLSGLNLGEQVVVNGQSGLQHESAIRIL